MRRYFFGVCLALGLLLTTCPSRADSLTFTVIPPDVSGPAGTTVGWGFSITNTSTSDYLDISGIDSDLFAATDGIPDASIFLFPNLAPGQTETQNYDPVDQLGLFQFTWNSGLAVGTKESGQFQLSGAFCDPAVDQFCAEDGSVSRRCACRGRLFGYGESFRCGYCSRARLSRPSAGRNRVAFRDAETYRLGTFTGQLKASRFLSRRLPKGRSSVSVRPTQVKDGEPWSYPREDSVGRLDSDK